MKMGKVNLPSATKFRDANTFEKEFKEAINIMIEQFKKHYCENPDFEKFQKILMRILSYDPENRPDFIQLFHEILNLKDLENLKLHIILEDCKENALELFSHSRSRIYQNNSIVDSNTFLKINLTFEN